MIRSTAFFILFGLAAIFLTACNSDYFADGYQVGDVTLTAVEGLSELQQAIKDYCDQNADDVLRKIALKTIRLRYPEIPENGICPKAD
ncbi:MAG: hypothetical protein ACU836_16370 [Gammaproteobacteria bacterium]